MRNMDIEHHFGLAAPPYRISPDPRFLYYSAQVREAIEKCKYMTRHRVGPLYLYGPIGSGKTTLLKQLASLFRDEKPYLVAYLISPNIKTANAFLRVIMEEFEVKTARAYAQSLRNFERFLLAQHRAGRVPLLLVDEAQNMNTDMLRLIHYLLNFETTKVKLLQIVLAGQEHLARRISQFKELASRMFPVSLTGMSPHDLSAMIEYRWLVAGGAAKPPFAPDALRAIFAHSKGLPRDAVKLCDESLGRITNPRAPSCHEPWRCWKWPRATIAPQPRHGGRTS
jgi:general secretion pathway protein A